MKYNTLTNKLRIPLITTAAAGLAATTSYVAQWGSPTIAAGAVGAAGFLAAGGLLYARHARLFLGYAAFLERKVIGGEEDVLDTMIDRIKDDHSGLKFALCLEHLVVSAGSKSRLETKVRDRIKGYFTRQRLEKLVTIAVTDYVDRDIKKTLKKALTDLLIDWSEAAKNLTEILLGVADNYKPVPGVQQEAKEIDIFYQSLGLLSSALLYREYQQQHRGLRPKTDIIPEEERLLWINIREAIVIKEPNPFFLTDHARALLGHLDKHLGPRHSTPPHLAVIRGGGNSD